MQKEIQKTTFLNYGRHINESWVIEYLSKIKKNNIRILDVGCGEGLDLDNLKRAISFQGLNKNLELYGIEYRTGYIKSAEKKGIKIFSLDIERSPWPIQDDFFDIVVANQILEHIKEIFWVCSEISRILIPGGLFIIGVPNLASLHNRFLLLFGEQPSTLEVLSAHVRGFSYPAFRRFIEAEDYFKVEKIRGSNFYPFPIFLSRVLSRLFPTLSVGLFFLVRRTSKKGTFINVLNMRNFESNFYSGVKIV